MSRVRYGPDNPGVTYVPHKYEEQLFDSGEFEMNYAVAGSSDKPAVLLIPAQTESWWGYEQVMARLENHFQLYAVDLRGQGRSSRTPGRYTFDNMGNDLVKFLAFVIRRPAVVCGLSSGGVLSAWLSAYAPPGSIRGAYYEDPPLFAVELTPEIGPSIRQSVPGAMFPVISKYLGDQWGVGDWEGLMEACRQMMAPEAFKSRFGDGSEPSQQLKEYDPEWARACYEGTISASCNHARMLSQVKCPVLFTRHSCFVDEATGKLAGGVSDEQLKRIEKSITEAGQSFVLKSFPEMGHPMHVIDPDLWVKTFTEWERTLPSDTETKNTGIF